MFILLTADRYSQLELIDVRITGEREVEEEDSCKYFDPVIYMDGDVGID